MSEDWKLAFWERELAKAEERFKVAPATLKELQYWNDVAIHKSILRTVRLDAHLPICWGAVDCVETPLQKCKAGKHETCEQHRDTCLHCKASG